jgi:hypothetical protein
LLNRQQLLEFRFEEEILCEGMILAKLLNIDSCTDFLIATIKTSISTTNNMVEVGSPASGLAHDVCTHPELQ